MDVTYVLPSMALAWVGGLHPEGINSPETVNLDVIKFLGLLPLFKEYLGHDSLKFSCATCLITCECESSSL